MGAPNFARLATAKNYYAVLMNYEEKVKECEDCFHEHPEWEYNLGELHKCDNCGSDNLSLITHDKSPESYEWDDFISNMGYAIEELGGTLEDDWIDSSGAYSSRKLGTLSVSKKYGDVYLEVIVTAIIVSAYHEGANLDYHVHLDICDGETWPISTGSYYDNTVEKAMDVAFDSHNSELKQGILNIMKPKATVWVEEQIEALGDKMEELFSEWSQHKLKCIGIASNGEGFYEKTN